MEYGDKMKYLRTQLYYCWLLATIVSSTCDFFLAPAMQRFYRALLLPWLYRAFKFSEKLNPPPLPSPTFSGKCFFGRGQNEERGKINFWVHPLPQRHNGLHAPMAVAHRACSTPFITTATWLDTKYVFK
jgi:hypothetical protein